MAVIRRFHCLWQLWVLLFIQRFSVLACLPIALLSLVPGSLVFDQIPDIERRWLDTPIGLWQAGAAGFVHFLILVPAVFWLGRFRTDAMVPPVRSDDRWPRHNADGTPRRQNV
ncbi:hypothetical protein E0H75_42665 [Kribbella capetownensis]|uniref:Uncharacterized protein n=1 Tax=Kribbella capetownensis TaxID=1572659 RepID=A0A4R0IIZ0_9ACTN|nr:hypothetical protein [Kribbella capetownensis]TCC32647.1 hypothetical protein E0H75_42665 [Kribbella capetownensis]